MLVRDTIVPKSDQLNVDDFASSEKTVEIVKVSIINNADQPMLVYIAGEQRPWKPCKSSRRIMAEAWGDDHDGSGFVGKMLTLYCDTTVTYGRDRTGGIRFSAMSHVGNKPRDFIVTKKRGVRTIVTINPLQPYDQAAAPQQQAAAKPQQQQSAQQAAQQPTPEQVNHCRNIIAMATTMDQLIAAWGQIPPAIKSMVAADKDAKKLEIETAPKPEPEPEVGIDNF